MVHDEYLSGQMDRGADGWVRGQGGLHCPRGGAGVVGRTGSFKSRLGGRTQDLHLTPRCPRPSHPTTCPQQAPHQWPPLGVLVGPTFRAPPLGSGQGILPTPYLPLPILFDTPNDSIQNFCREGREDSGCRVLWPQHAPKPAGPRGWASIFFPVCFSLPSVL